MFRIKFLPWVALWLSLALFSCEEEHIVDKKPAPQLPTDTISEGSLLTKKQWAPTDFISYTYDAQQRLSRYESSWLYMAPDVTQTYTLAADYQQDSLRYVSNSMDEYLEYFYHQGKIAEAIYFRKDQQILGWYVFQLTANNQLKEIWHLIYNDQTSDELQITKFDYDTQGNVTSIRVSVAINSSTQNLREIHRTEFGNYDTKKNPEPFIHGDIYLPGVKLSVNNPGYKEEIVGGQVDKRFEYRYTYNDKGYPLNRKERMVSHPHVAGLDVRYHYE